MDYPLYINGGQVAGPSEQIIELPYDGSDVAHVHQAAAEQVELAVAAARAASLVMRELSLDERSTILRKTYAMLLEQREEMALAISSE